MQQCSRLPREHYSSKELIMATVKQYPFVKLIIIQALCITSIYGSLVHRNNLRQRTQEMADHYLSRQGIYKYTIPLKLLPEYNDHIETAVYNAEQMTTSRGQNFIDSEYLTTIIQHEMQNFLKTLQTIVKPYELDAAVTAAIHQELTAHGLSPDSIPSELVGEYHQKGSLIINKLRSNMFYDRRDYIRKMEIEHIVRDELSAFIQRVKNKISTQSKNNQSLTGWHWWNSFFGGAPTEKTATNSSFHINRADLETKTLEIVYTVLRKNDINPDTIPARIVSNYSDAVQKIISRMKNVMAAQWRDYVGQSEIEQAAREELQPIIDAINYKNETCSICLDHYHKNDRVGTLSCGHTFHEDCIRSWFAQQKTCPLCRATNVIVAKIESAP